MEISDTECDDRIAEELLNDKGVDFFNRSSHQLPSRLSSLTVRQKECALKGFFDYQTLYLSAYGTENDNEERIKSWVKLGETWIVNKLVCDDEAAVEHMTKLNDLVARGCWRGLMRQLKMDAPPVIYEIIFKYFNSAPIIPDVQEPKTYPPGLDEIHMWTNLKWMVPPGDSLRVRSHPNNDKKDRYRPLRGLGWKRKWCHLHVPYPKH